MIHRIHLSFSWISTINYKNWYKSHLVFFWVDIVQKFCLGVADRLDDGDGHDHDYSGKDQANADVGKYRLSVVTL